MRNTLKSCLVVIGVLACAGLGCRTRAPETPAVAADTPPPIEPALAAGSQLIDPRADQLVRQMSDLLASTSTFDLEAEEIYDEVPEQSPRQQLTSIRQVALRRPNRLAGDTTGDAVNRAFWYDGRTLSVLDKEQFVWSDGLVPATIDDTLDTIFEKTGTVIPLADFLYANPYDQLMGDVQRGVYLGIHDVGGVPCHHLSFEQATIDWQIWIDAGPKPLPRKLVIAYKTEDEVPQYSVTIRHWNLTPNTPDARFHFTPPAGAKRIDVPALQEEGR